MASSDCLYLTPSVPPILWLHVELSATDEIALSSCRPHSSSAGRIMSDDHKIRFFLIRVNANRIIPRVNFRIRHQSLLSLTNHTSRLSHHRSWNDSICQLTKLFWDQSKFPWQNHKKDVTPTQMYDVIFSYWHSCLYFDIVKSLFTFLHPSTTFY